MAEDTVDRDPTAAADLYYGEGPREEQSAAIEKMAAVAGRIKERVGMFKDDPLIDSFPYQEQTAGIQTEGARHYLGGWEAAAIQTTRNNGWVTEEITLHGVDRKKNGIRIDLKEMRMPNGSVSRREINYAVIGEPNFSIEVDGEKLRREAGDAVRIRKKGNFQSHTELLEEGQYIDTFGGRYLPPEVRDSIVDRLCLASKKVDITQPQSPTSQSQPTIPGSPSVVAE